MHSPGKIQAEASLFTTPHWPPNKRMIYYLNPSPRYTRYNTGVSWNNSKRFPSVMWLDLSGARFRRNVNKERRDQTTEHKPAIHTCIIHCFIYFNFWVCPWYVSTDKQIKKIHLIWFDLICVFVYVVYPQTNKTNKLNILF